MTLDAEALSDYTQGRLAADDQTTTILNAAAAAARRWCGWHVTPVVSNQVVTLDGPGGPYLHLPTMNITAMGSVVEDGTTLDLTKLAISPRGVIAKKTYQQPLAPLSQSAFSSPRPWNYWTDTLAGIVVTFSHGYASADDFETAVLSIADRMSQAGGSGMPTAVGPFRWAGETRPGELFTNSEVAILEQYRLERTP